MSCQQEDDFEIVRAETVGACEPRWWITTGQKISLKWFARKRVLYTNSIWWPRLPVHDRAVVSRRPRGTSSNGSAAPDRLQRQCSAR